MTKTRASNGATQSMSFENRRDRALLLRIEPWGDEHPILPGERFRIVARSAEGSGELHFESSEGVLTVYGWQGSTLHLEKGGVKVADYDIPVPRMPEIVAEGDREPASPPRRTSS